MYEDDSTGTNGSGERSTPSTDLLAGRRDVLRAAGAGVAATGLGAGAVGSASASEHGIETPWLHVEGNRVLDPEGNEVILRGVNIPDPKRLDQTVPVRGKNWNHVIDLATDHDRGWFSRVIRIPVHPWDVAELPPVPVAEDMSSPPSEFTEGGYYQPPIFDQDELLEYCEEYLDEVVDYCAEQNVYCIVDFHRHWGDGDLEWHVPELDEEVRLFWETVAPRYAEDSHVIFEVYNEPTNPAMYNDEWYNAKYAGIWRRWKATAQPWVDIIRKHAPENPIIVGSPGWSAMPEGAQIEEFDGGDLMYAYHIYGGHGLSSDSDFDGRQADEGTAGVWEDVPLFMTEFGWEPNIGQWISGQTDGFGNAVMSWADDRPIHWTAWCFDITWLPTMWDRGFGDGDPDDSVGDPYSGDLPEECPDPPCEWELLGRDVGDYDTYMGEPIRQLLEERADDDVPQVPHDDVTPAAPSDLSVGAVDERSAELSWSAVTETGVSDRSHYLVTVDGEPWQETTDTSAVVDDLIAGRTQELGVSAVDEYGNVGERATVQVTTDDLAASEPPTAPPDATLDDRTHSSVTLSWAEASASGSADVARYVVYVEGDEVARLRDETTYRLTDLELDGEYEVAITAIDRAGQESEPLSAVVRPRPAHATEDDVLINDYEHEDPLTENSLGGWVGGGVGSGVEDGKLQLSWDGTDYYGTTVDVDATDTPNLKLKARGEKGFEISMLALRAGDDDEGVPVGDVTDDRIRTDWGVVTIDLEAVGADVSQPGQLQFDTVWGTAGEAEVDELWLAGEDDPADGIEIDGSIDPQAPTSPDDQWTNEVTDATIEMEWESVLRADHYNVYLDGDEVDETSTTTYTFDGLDPETEYVIGVEAENSEGTSDLVETTVETLSDGGEGPCEGLDTMQVDGQRVCNVDGDEYYRDVNGDGNVGNRDVGAFFENFHLDAWDREAFDYSGNGRVSHGDVVALFDHVI